MNSSKSNAVLLCCILGVAAYLRFGNLGVSSFWVDELDFVYAAKSEMETGQPLLNSGYAYPRAMLFTYSIIASFKAFGISEFSSRLPAAVFGLLSVWLIYVVGKRWFNARAGLLAALFLAVSPFAVGWSRTSRMYSLFQFLFLAAAYLIYRGFEAAERDEEARPPRRNLVERIRHLHEAWGLNYWLLAVGGVVLYLSYLTHELAGLYALSFVLYLFVVGVALVLAKQQAAATKYLVTLAVLVVVGVVAVLAAPPVQSKIREGLAFLPKWAEVSAAQNRLRLWDYLMSEEMVPLNVFFLIGAVQCVAQARKEGIYLLALLASPLALFTFVFSFQKNSYIFHVYPAMVLLAACAVDRLMRHEVMTAAGNSLWVWLDRRRLSSLKAPAVAVLFLGWLPLTFWCRLALSTPRQADGQYNGAVYHAEWRQATDYVRSQMREDDTLISTLPMTVQYYLGRADYNLNRPNADLARQHNIVGGDGTLIDYYSGADIIEDAAELVNVIDGHAQGWLIVDNYRFDEPVYVPRDIRQIVDRRMMKKFETKRNTMTIFGWSHAPVAP